MDLSNLSTEDVAMELGYARLREMSLTKRLAEAEAKLAPEQPADEPVSIRKPRRGTPTEEGPTAS